MENLPGVIPKLVFAFAQAGQSGPVKVSQVLLRSVRFSEGQPGPVKVSQVLEGQPGLVKVSQVQ